MLTHVIKRPPELIWLYIAAAVIGFIAMMATDHG